MISLLSKSKTKFQVLATGESLDLHPITSAHEKAALEIQAIKSEDPEGAFDDICELYGISRELPESIKIAGLMKVREISNGSDCRVKFKCLFCNRPSEGVALLENLLDFSAFEKVEKFRDLKLAYFEPLMIRDILNAKMTDAPKFFQKPPLMATLFDVKDLFESLIKRLPRLKKVVECKCPLCGGNNPITISKEFCMNALSEHSITTMYKTYHALVINGFTKMDVDSMLPFEREAQKGLIDRMIEKRRNAQNPKNTQNAPG